MAANSAARGDSGGSRIPTAASVLSSDCQSLVAEIRRGLSMMKSVAVDLEKENRSEMVKKLEDAVLELLSTWEDCAVYSTAIAAAGKNYRPKDELTDFKKLLEDEVAKVKKDSVLVPQNNPFLRQFKEAVWNVHHAGQPMPGEEQEDVVMTNTQSNLLNITCPLSGKPVIDLERPVRSADCMHIYERDAVMHYMRSKKSAQICPVAGCPKPLSPDKVICDPFLPIEIDELRLRSKESAQTAVLEDVAELDEY